MSEKIRVSWMAVSPNGNTTYDRRKQALKKFEMDTSVVRVVRIESRWDGGHWTNRGSTPTLVVER